MSILKTRKNIFGYKTAFLLAFGCFITVIATACALPGWDTDLKAFVETGLSTAYLKSARYAQEGNEANADVRSGVPVTVTVLLNNPKDLALDYTLGYDESLVAGTAAAPANTTATTNSVTTATFTFTPTETAEHGDISFSLGMSAPALGKTFTPATFTVHCDSPPDPVNNLTAGVQADNRACIGFTLPENIANGDISAVEITYKNDATGATKTVTKETGQKGTGLTVVPSPALLDSNIAKYIRYYIPEDVVAGNPYTFSVVTVDSSGKKSVKATTPAQVSVTGTEVFLGYDANGGTGSVAAKYGYNLTTTTAIAAGASLSRDGYGFTGWNTKADGSGKAYTPGASYTFGSSSLMLFAQWRKLSGISVSITTPNYQGVTVTQNGNSSLTMDKDGTLSLQMAIPSGAANYQWYLNGATISAATSASYKFQPSSQSPVITSGTYTITATALYNEVYYSGNITVIVTNTEMVTVIPYGKSATYQVISVNSTASAESDAISFYDKISPFSIAKTEMTYPFWNSVYTWAIAHGYAFANPGASLNPASTDNYAVGEITWNDAIVWCNGYSEMMGLQPCYTYVGNIIRDSTNTTACSAAIYDRTKNGYRLPTEAEWQFAASGREEVAWNMVSGYPYTAWPAPTGSGSSHYANYDPSTGPVIKQVAELVPNCLGLFDMSGNSWEYCFDFYSPAYPIGSSATTPITNYSGPASGTDRVIRSGSYLMGLDSIIIGSRWKQIISTDASTGFRLARSITE